MQFRSVHIQLGLPDPAPHLNLRQVNVKERMLFGPALDDVDLDDLKQRTEAFRDNDNGAQRRNLGNSTAVQLVRRLKCRLPTIHLKNLNDVSLLQYALSELQAAYIFSCGGVVLN